jgi:NADP-dependent 3-hydroxy acid dehydrogenase YdfG
MAQNKPITDWKDRRVWIIGASTGIGAALADLLAEKGARLALSARRAGPLEEMAKRYGAGRAIAAPLDITDAAALAAATKRIAAEWGGIDVVVFMAGDYAPMHAWDIDLAAMRKMIEVNLVGFYNGLAAVVPQMLKQGNGMISLVSSVAGYRGLPKSLVYGPTKAALINLAEALYLDLQPKGIGVTVINPGFVKTPLTANNEFRMPYLITPEEAAREIVSGFATGDFEIHFPKAFSKKLKLLRHLSYGLYFAAVRRSLKA